MTLVSAVFNCTYNAGGVVSSCAASSVTVNITLRITPRSNLRLQADSIISAVTQNATDPPGNVTFTGFSGGGWFDRCGPNVTALRLINTTVNPNIAIVTIPGLSIPITCR